jgi:hypothetical protein
MNKGLELGSQQPKGSKLVILFCFLPNNQTKLLAVSFSWGKVDAGQNSTEEHQQGFHPG